VPAGVTLALNSNQTLTNRGSLTFDGAGASFSISNLGTFINEGTALFDNGAALHNMGTLENNGAISLNSASIMNNGSIINSGGIAGTGGIDQQAGSSFANNANSTVSVPFGFTGNSTFTNNNTANGAVTSALTLRSGTTVTLGGTLFVGTGDVQSITLPPTGVSGIVNTGNLMLSNPSAYQTNADHTFTHNAGSVSINLGLGNTWQNLGEITINAQFMHFNGTIENHGLMRFLGGASSFGGDASLTGGNSDTGRVEIGPMSAVTMASWPASWLLYSWDGNTAVSHVSSETRIFHSDPLASRWRLPYPSTITINSQPEPSTTVTAGNISGSLYFNASMLGTGTLAYQWHRNATDSNVDGTPETGAGANTSVFTIPTDLAVGTYYFYCVVSEAGGLAAPLTTNVAVVIVE
jgi:hypothetical protein